MVNVSETCSFIAQQEKKRTEVNTHIAEQDAAFLKYIELVVIVYAEFGEEDLVFIG